MVEGVCVCVCVWGGGVVEWDEGGDGVLNIEQNCTRIRNNLRMFLFEENYEA